MTRRPTIERHVPFERMENVSCFSVSSSEVAQVKRAKAVVLRVYCTARWPDTHITMLAQPTKDDMHKHKGWLRVALLENESSHGIEKAVEEISVPMKLGTFHDTIRPGHFVIFTSDESRAVFRVESIVSGEGFRSRDCLIDGPENDMT